MLGHDPSFETATREAIGTWRAGVKWLSPVRQRCLLSSCKTVVSTHCSHVSCAGLWFRHHPVAITSSSFSLGIGPRSIRRYWSSCRIPQASTPQRPIPTSSCAGQTSGRMRSYAFAAFHRQCQFNTSSRALSGHDSVRQVCGCATDTEMAECPHVGFAVRRARAQSVTPAEENLGHVRLQLISAELTSHRHARKLRDS